MIIVEFTTSLVSIISLGWRMITYVIRSKILLVLSGGSSTCSAPQDQS